MLGIFTVSEILLACCCCSLHRQCGLVRDVAGSAAGDVFTFETMLRMRSKDWIQSLLVPWIIFFALAMVASSFSFSSKLYFFVKRMRSRIRRLNNSNVTSPQDLEIAELLDLNEFQKRKVYMYACSTALHIGAHALLSLCAHAHAHFPGPHSCVALYCGGVLHRITHAHFSGISWSACSRSVAP